MTSEYEKRRSDWAKKAQDEEETDRQKEIIIGETAGKVEKDINAAQELKVKINDVGPLQLKTSINLSKGDSVKISIKADPSLGDQHKLTWGREKPSHLDEALGTVTGKIKKDHEIKIKIDYIDIQKIKSSEDLNKGDSIRVILGKV
ncbi:MAG: hypothetical protein JW762_11785 [Dehalococcoidales bacterium]|nr:hypothetical protein [Dehalococcoidales bacterium]